MSKPMIEKENSRGASTKSRQFLLIKQLFSEEPNLYQGVFTDKQAMVFDSRPEFWKGYLLRTDPEIVDVGFPQFDMVSSRFSKEIAETEEARTLAHLINSAQNSRPVRVRGKTPADIPLFVADDLTVRPKQYDVLVRLQMGTFAELPDVHVDIESTLSAFKLMNDRSGRSNLNEVTDPKLRSVALMKKIAESSIPVGLFLPVEIHAGAWSTPGVLRILKFRNDGICCATLYQLDGSVAPRPGHLLRRTVLWKQRMLPQETSALIAIVA